MPCVADWHGVRHPAFSWVPAFAGMSGLGAAVHRVPLVAVAILSVASAAFARPGDAAHPIVLKMQRGTDSVTVHGVLRQGVDCCAYTFKAHASQMLYWSQTGAAARIGLAYPNGDGVNPGLPNPTPLPQTGVYVFTVSPNLMADGGFGPFRLKLRIPPAR